MTDKIGEGAAQQQHARLVAHDKAILKAVEIEFEEKADGAERRQRKHAEQDEIAAKVFFVAAQKIEIAQGKERHARKQSSARARHQQRQ